MFLHCDLDPTVEAVALDPVVAGEDDSDVFTVSEGDVVVRAAVMLERVRDVTHRSRPGRVGA